jgi:hypothetical protein
MKCAWIQLISQQDNWRCNSPGARIVGLQRCQGVLRAHAVLPLSSRNPISPGHSIAVAHCKHKEKEYRSNSRRCSWRAFWIDSHTLPSLILFASPEESKQESRSRASSRATCRASCHPVSLRDADVRRQQVSLRTGASCPKRNARLHGICSGSASSPGIRSWFSTRF